MQKITSIDEITCSSEFEKTVTHLYGSAEGQTERYKNLYDRFSEILKFETFGVNDLSQIIGQLSEITFTPDAIEYIHSKFNRFRQIVQLINQMETFAKDNNLAEITKEIVEQIV